MWDNLQDKLSVNVTVALLDSSRMGLMWIYQQVKLWVILMGL